MWCVFRGCWRDEDFLQKEDRTQVLTLLLHHRGFVLARNAHVQHEKTVEETVFAFKWAQETDLWSSVERTVLWMWEYFCGFQIQSMHKNNKNMITHPLLPDITRSPGLSYAEKRELDLKQEVRTPKGTRYFKWRTDGTSLKTCSQTFLDITEKDSSPVILSKF